jgi:hypothetical protein
VLPIANPDPVNVDEIALRDGRILERHAAPTFGRTRADGAGRRVPRHHRRQRNENALEDRVERRRRSPRSASSR